MDITIKGAGGGPSRIGFGSLGSLASELDLGRTVVVTDGLLRRAYGSSFPPCPVVEVERGEAAKSLASLEALYGRFLELGLGRDGLVLGVGGGSVSDLAGFAASTWLRGVGFGFVPTTLLAMVDASVGGKNGVDFRGIKNLVGTFSQPGFVRMDVSLLASLPETEFASGMAEVVKHAVISGGPYFGLLESLTAKGRSGMSAGELEAVVAGSVELKAAVVSRDEREAGERRVLNLGHTLGHALEAATGLPHGHSVAAGLGSICRLAVRMGRLARTDCDRVTRLLSAWGLPSSIGEAAALWAAKGGRGDGKELRGAVAAAIPADKKRVGGEVLVALPEAIGSVRIVSVTLSTLQDFAKEAP